MGEAVLPLVALLLFVSVVAGCGAQKETKPDEVKEEEPSGTESEGADEEETPAEEPIEEVEVTFLHCWNGSRRIPSGYGEQSGGSKD